MKKKIESVLKRFMHSHDFTLNVLRKGKKYELTVENPHCGDWKYALASELFVYTAQGDYNDNYTLIYDKY